MIHELPPDRIASWAHFGALSDLEKSRLGPQSPWLEHGQICTFALEDAGVVLGRVSAFVNPRLQDQTAPTGLLGCFAFTDAAFDSRGAELRALVDQACGWLRARGMQRVRGPMNFCTWYSYRVESESADYPRFPGEDVLDQRYARFLETFMQPLGTYASQLIEDPESARKVAQQLGVDRAGKLAGITVEELTRERTLAELKPFYDLASEIFPQDFSYGPIGFDEMQQLYVPVIQRLPDYYALIARNSSGRPIGLAYGYMHPFAPVKTSILKTVGVLPEYRRGLSRGVSWYLTYTFHYNLHERGYVQFIHSTMKEDNTSRAMSSRFARKIREYKLYETAL